MMYKMTERLSCVAGERREMRKPMTRRRALDILRRFYAPPWKRRRIHFQPTTKQEAEARAFLGWEESQKFVRRVITD